MKKSIFPLFVFLFIFSSLSGEIVNGIACKVGDQIITINEFNTAYEKESLRARAMGVSAPSKKEVMQMLIEKLLIEKEAEQRGVLVNPKEVEIIIENIKKESNLSEEQFKQQLHREQITLEELKESYRLQLLRTRLINQMVMEKGIQVTESQIREFYEAPSNRHLFVMEPTVVLSNILIPVPLDASYREVKRIRAIADEIYKRAGKGENLEELASIYSREKEINIVKNDLGSFNKTQLSTIMNLEDAEMIFSMNQGEVTQPIRFRDGYYIFRVMQKRQEKKLSLEEAYENIKSYLMKKEGEALFRDWLEMKKKNTRIKYMIDVG